MSEYPAKFLTWEEMGIHADSQELLIGYYDRDDIAQPIGPILERIEAKLDRLLERGQEGSADETN
jgi:hypothetical protein